VHAALGIANLRYTKQVLADRKEKYNYYKTKLSTSDKLIFQLVKHGETNYSYFPVIFESEAVLLKVEAALGANKIFPRRYFYPSVNTYTKIVAPSSMPVSENFSKRILCLPLYYKLTMEQIDTIIKIVLETI
jgi:hypothetical protein